jgi:hypothetical protein
MLAGCCWLDCWLHTLYEAAARWRLLISAAALTGGARCALAAASGRTRVFGSEISSSQLPVLVPQYGTGTAVPVPVRNPSAYMYSPAASKSLARQMFVYLPYYRYHGII